MPFGDLALPPFSSKNYTLNAALDPSSPDAPFEVSRRDVLWAIFWAWFWLVVSWGFLFMQISTAYYHIKARWDINKVIERYERMVGKYERIVGVYKNSVDMCRSTEVLYSETAAEYRVMAAECMSALEDINRRVTQCERVGGIARVLEAAMGPLNGVRDGLRGWNKTMEWVRRAVDSGVLEGDEARAVVALLGEVVREMKERVECFSGCLLGMREVLDDKGNNGVVEYLKAWVAENGPRGPSESACCLTQDAIGEDLGRLFAEGETL